MSQGVLRQLLLCDLTGLLESEDPYPSEGFALPWASLGEYEALGATLTDSDSEAPQVIVIIDHRTIFRGWQVLDRDVGQPHLSLPCLRDMRK